MTRTYDEILTELKQFVKQRWPNWNTEARHIGNILLECLADQIEKQEYRIDAVENELFPDTATKYESLLRWARLVGYEVQSARPAEVTLTFSVQEPASTNISIPLGTKVSTPGPDPIPFMTTVAAVIPAGQTSVDVAAKQVEEKEDTFSGTGEASQVYQTSYGPVWLDSLRVLVDGQEWTRVRDFLLSGSSDTHYVAELQEDGTVLIIFGDGVNGKAPFQGATVEFQYKVTRGKEGNVPAGAINIVETVLYDANSYLADVRVTNVNPATGGEDQEDINHLREAIPAWVTTTNRCVTRNDFTEAAQSVTGVQRVLVLTNEQDPTIPPLTVLIYVVPEGGGAPSQALLDAVMQEVTVNRPKLLTLAVDVKPAKYFNIDVSCTVTVAPSYSPVDVQSKVYEAIKQFFDYARKEDEISWAIDFGKPIYLAKLTAWVASVRGVANVVFDSPTADVIPAADTLPALGAVTVNVI
ncbi:baseplate J/gp47 family protein [Thermoanaerobacterium sp. DL9XJH110]|uniref:baseplate J/gp47 family protein n=1 Tax=Thermoanaerobacterium sp. DL9XJH110 TaxID=3386643 RepID=UPI003BB5B882